MDKVKGQVIVEKQKITKLLHEEMFILEKSKEFCRDHQTIKKAVKNMTNGRDS